MKTAQRCDQIFIFFYYFSAPVSNDRTLAQTSEYGVFTTDWIAHLIIKEINFYLNNFRKRMNYLDKLLC